MGCVRVGARGEQGELMMTHTKSRHKTMRGSPSLVRAAMPWTTCAWPAGYNAAVPSGFGKRIDRMAIRGRALAMEVNR